MSLEKNYITQFCNLNIYEQEKELNNLVQIATQKDSDIFHFISNNLDGFYPFLDESNMYNFAQIGGFFAGGLGTINIFYHIIDKESFFVLDYNLLVRQKFDLLKLIHILRFSR